MSQYSLAAGDIGGLLARFSDFKCKAKQSSLSCSGWLSGLLRFARNDEWQSAERCNASLRLWVPAFAGTTKTS
jgi:hypothetical protein